tara:strand:- start:3047 stop:3346 length:300 start_codon:yes stop_codon:yes gene_type:complete
MSLETVAESWGFPAFVVCVTGIAVYRVLVFVGRRLLDSKDGIVTTLMTRHIEFLDNLERTNNAMLTAQQQHSREMQEQTRVLRTLTENTTILAREIQSG